MIMIGISNLFGIVGGLSLILYGIHLSGINLQKILGSYLEEVLKKAAGRPLRGVAIGAAITGLIHSSGTTAVMLLGLITGGIISLNDAVPVMLGANIGSTLATQLASFHIGSYALLFLTAGVLVHLSARRKAKKRIGEALIGFSFLFLGMGLLFSEVASLSREPQFVAAVQDLLAGSAVKTMIIGALASFLLQSATAASVLAVALAGSSAIGLAPALYLILGINLGSSLKVVGLALRGKNFSGKLALIHLVFNLFGMAVFLVFFPLYLDFAEWTAFDAGRQVANAHTFYNIVCALVFLPLVPFVARAVEKTSLRSKPLHKDQLSYLDPRLICTPSVSLEQVNRGIMEMARITRDMLEATREILFDGKMDNLHVVEEGERAIDEMTEKMTEYTIQISQQNLSHQDKLKLFSLMHMLADIEHLADHILVVANVFADYGRDGEALLTEKAERELMAVFGKLRIMQNLVIKSLGENNSKLAGEIIQHENKVDEIIKKIAANHQDRLDEGVCSPRAAKYFTETLYNLERVGDHYDNVAFAIIDRFRHEERNKS